MIFFWNELYHLGLERELATWILEKWFPYSSIAICGVEPVLKSNPYTVSGSFWIFHEFSRCIQKLLRYPEQPTSWLSLAYNLSSKRENPVTSGQIYDTSQVWNLSRGLWRIPKRSTTQCIEAPPSHKNRHSLMRCPEIFAPRDSAALSVDSALIQKVLEKENKQCSHFFTRHIICK